MINLKEDCSTTDIDACAMHMSLVLNISCTNYSNKNYRCWSSGASRYCS